MNPIDAVLTDALGQTLGLTLLQLQARGAVEIERGAQLVDTLKRQRVCFSSARIISWPEVKKTRNIAAILATAMHASRVHQGRAGPRCNEGVG